MPAWTKDGDVLCFFQGAAKFKTRYATLGFSDKADLDKGSMWPTLVRAKEVDRRRRGTNRRTGKKSGELRASRLGVSQLSQRAGMCPGGTIGCDDYRVAGVTLGCVRLRMAPLVAGGLALLLVACGVSTFAESDEFSTATVPVEPLCGTVPPPAPERAGVQETMPDLYALAEAGGIGDTQPRFLGSAVAPVPSRMLPGLRYVGCSVEDSGGGLVFEQMMWTNGSGYLMIFWQEWPDTAPESGPPVDDGATTLSLGDTQVTVSSRDLGPADFWTVRFFDGDRTLSLEAYALPNLSDDAMTNIGWIVWTGLPTVPR